MRVTSLVVGRLGLGAEGFDVVEEPRGGEDGRAAADDLEALLVVPRDFVGAPHLGVGDAAEHATNDARHVLRLSLFLVLGPRATAA